MKRPATLTARFVETVSQPGRYGDGRGGHGLSLLVKPMASTGRLSKTWSQRIRIGGREANVGLGAYPVVTLAEARKAVLANKRAIAKGVDPRTGAGAVPTFAVAVERVIALHAATWREGGKSKGQWRSSLDTYAKSLMPMPVDRIGPGDVLAVLTPIWNEKRETARRLKQRIAAVLKWSIAEGHRTDDPVDAIAAALPKNGVTKRHHRALAYDRVGAALAAVRESGAWWATKAAIAFLVLTAVRSGEVRGARWNEINMSTATWTIPGERMKASRPHRIPLSDAAIDVLREASAHRDGSGLVFPAARGGRMSDVVLSQLLKRHHIGGTAHGMRSAFRDWASECTDTPHAVMEAALAHAIRNKAEAAYARSDLFEKRRKLMNDWAKFLQAES